MKLNAVLNSINSKIHNAKGRRFRHNSHEISDYLNAFDSPRDDIERSFFQYKCQKWDTMGCLEVILGNIVAAILLIPKYFHFRNRKINPGKKFDAVVTLPHLMELLPNDFTGDATVSSFNDGLLSKDDGCFLLNVFSKHPFSFLFNYKVMCRVASYSLALKLFQPDIIFASAEYSFSSSILTSFCEKNGVQHNNIMHGEKNFNPREAFCRFNKFYIWDEYYEDLFRSLRADKSIYIINPIKMPVIKPTNDFSHCVYYLQLHTYKQLLSIKEALERTNLEYKVRTHPVYSYGLEEKVFGPEHVETKDTSIWESIREAGYVISQDSTVLFQAYQVRASIVIDDLSDPIYYENLRERGYIMLHKPHLLLSDISDLEKA